MAEPSGTQYGGFWIRFLALLVDSAIVFLVSALVMAGAAMALGPEMLTMVALVVWLLGFLYWPVMHASARQATFGKALLGLKVARFDGRRISILRSLVRELAKIISGAVLMIGYVMAAFTPRKQALHDLVASTYVVREGASRVVPALAVLVAGFAVPVVVVPMIVGAAVMSMMTNMAEGMVSSTDPMKPAAKAAAPVAKAAPKPQAPAPTQTAQAPVPAQPAPAPVQKPEAVTAPAPQSTMQAQVAAAPASAAAPKPQPVALAKPAPVAVAKPAPMVEVKPVEDTKPAQEAKPKPKPAPTRIAAAPKVSAAPAFEPKSVEGPKYNDLMTAVLYRDTEGVSELLKLGKWADKPDTKGSTPLMVAVALGDASTAEALLRGGANPAPAISVAEQRRDYAMLELLKRYASR